MQLSQRSITHNAITEPAAKQRIVDKALIGFRKHGTVGAAAKFAKIDRRTLRDWLNNDPLMKILFSDADEEVTDELEESAIKVAKDGDSRMLIHLLASRSKRYAAKTIHVHEVAGADSLVHQVKLLAAAQPTMAPMIRAKLMLALEQLG